MFLFRLRRGNHIRISQERQARAKIQEQLGQLERREERKKTRRLKEPTMQI